MELKKYQQRTLDILGNFLHAAQVDVVKAFNQFQDAPGYPAEYQPLKLDGVPYVCLRLPIGGGKFLGA